ncbi:hypothetical protein BD310DRAFT_940261 [Dichomitus squalens]|uniref:BTB domain-containing protein n=1 Tax=Dichomitus squalens TaxID=114155 RepID=A0A4Q9PGK1_9APHY|nr:hypothetical protein BD310DRAFT_940261 [Dichomitus squalens]
MTLHQRPGDDGAAPAGPTSSAGIQKDNQLWLEDGSIILVAGQTGELFAVPQPIVSVDSLEGCPVVRVPDAAQELSHLLRYIYDGRSFIISTTGRPDFVKPTFATLSALMRLGHKYDIPEAIEDASSCLQSYYTTNFDVYKRLRQRDLVDLLFELREEDLDADAIETVNLAMLTGKHSLLPAAMYRCCQIDSDELIDGVQRPVRDARTVHLNADCIRLCRRGREHLIKACGRVLKVFGLLESPVRCGRCAPVAKQEGAGSIHDIELQLTTDPLELMYGSDALNALCSRCQTSMADHLAAQQRQIWCKLPVYLGIDDLEGVEMVAPSPLEGMDWAA